jgi:hypothetical protein
MPRRYCRDLVQAYNKRMTRIYRGSLVVCYRVKWGLPKRGILKGKIDHWHCARVFGLNVIRGYSPTKIHKFGNVQLPFKRSFPGYRTWSHGLQTFLNVLFFFFFVFRPSPYLLIKIKNKKGVQQNRAEQSIFSQDRRLFFFLRSADGFAATFRNS